MHYPLRTLLILLAVTLIICTIAVVGRQHVRASLLENYSALIQDGRQKGYKIDSVEREAFDEWLSVLSSPDWKTMKLGSDAYSASYNALSDAGYSPDMEGYLDLITADFPQGDKLSVAELFHWRNAAALRLVLTSAPNGKTLEVYREQEVVRAIRFPSSDPDTMIFAVRENGVYATYVAAPRSGNDSSTNSP